MRNVVVYMLLSLDGVAEEPGDWMTDFGEPIFDNLGQVIVAGSGVRLFTDADPKRTLRLLDATTTAGGSLFLRYGTGS